MYRPCETLWVTTRNRRHGNAMRVAICADVPARLPHLRGFTPVESGESGGNRGFDLVPGPVNGGINERGRKPAG